MPMWCPPTPPQQETDVYIDNTMSFLYETTNVMKETELPAVYVKKDLKRSRHEAGIHDTRRTFKLPRRQTGGTITNAPKSLFHSVAFLKLRRDLKLQKYRGLLRAAAVQLPTGPKTGGAHTQKPPIETTIWHDWTIHEEMALWKAIHMLRGQQFNLLTPGHTPNWDFVAELVNAVSVSYRTAKQCRHRFETVLTPREECKLSSLQPTTATDGAPTNPTARKRKKSPSPTKFPPGYQQRHRYSVKTSQLYIQDNNATFTVVINQRYDTLQAIHLKLGGTTVVGGTSSGQRPIIAGGGGGGYVKNPKHVAMLTECGIDLDRPLLPIDVALRRAERITKDKKTLTLEQQQLAARVHLMKGGVIGITAQQLAASQLVAPSGGTTVQQPSTSQQQQQQPQIPVVPTLRLTVTTNDITMATVTAPVTTTQTQLPNNNNSNAIVTAATVVTSQEPQLTNIVPQSIAIVSNLNNNTTVSSTITTIATSQITSGVNSSTPPRLIIVADPMRTQRMLAASPLQQSNVVSVAGLSPVQLHAATQRLIMSANNQQLAKTTVSSGGTPIVTHTKTISPAQLQLLRQQNALKQHHIRLQATSTIPGGGTPPSPNQGLKSTTLTISGQPTIVHFTQSSPTTQQFVRQAAVGAGLTTTTLPVISATKAVSGSVQQTGTSALVGAGDSGAAICAPGMKKTTHQQRCGVVVASAISTTSAGTMSSISSGVGAQTANIQRLSPSQIVTTGQQQQQLQTTVGGNQAICASQVATLVKTISNTAGGVTQTVTVPVSSVTAAKINTATLKAATTQQIRQLQLQQHVLAQKKLGAQKVNLTQVAAAAAAAASGTKPNVQTTQLIVGAKPLPTALAVQQFAQVMRTPITVPQGPVVLTKGTSPRVIPVSTAQGNKQTIQMVGASSQAIGATFRPTNTTSLANALAGIKVHSAHGSSAHTQQALLSQVSAALQNQTMAVRHGSPVRLQTASGASIVAVTVQPTTANIHQTANVSQSSSTVDQDQIITGPTTSGRGTKKQ